MLRGEISRPTGPARYAMSGRNHAPTLVLLSPTGSGLESWAPLLPQLEQFFRVVRLDLPAPVCADDALAVLVSVGSLEATLEPARVLAPALLVTATGSTSAPPEQVEQVQRQLIGAGLVVHDGGDDFIADQAGDVGTTLIEFLRD